MLLQRQPPALGILSGRCIHVNRPFRSTQLLVYGESRAIFLVLGRPLGGAESSTLSIDWAKPTS